MRRKRPAISDCLPRELMPIFAITHADRSQGLSCRSQSNNRAQKGPLAEVAVRRFMTPDLLTSRLRLRTCCEEDLTPFAAMNADPRVMEFFSKTLTRTESGALAERIRAQLNQHAFGLAVELVQQMPNSSVSSAWQKPLSDALYSLCRNRLEIGPKVFGAGYALEAAQRVLKYAFEDLCLPELVSFTAANNLRSQKLMHRLGLSGTLPTISSTRR